MRDKFLVSIISVISVIFIPALIVGVMGFVFYVHNTNYDEALQTLKPKLIQKQKELVKARVDGVVELINYQQSLITEELQNRVKDRVEVAHEIATAIYHNFHKTKSQKEIKEIIITTLRPLLWNDGESFIWIMNYDGVFQLAPKYLRHLEGQSIINFQDATGRYIIQEEIALCKKEGSGFLWDTFTKPNGAHGKQYKQLAYVKDFGHFNWYLGSGEYLDTAEKKMNTSLLGSIEKITIASPNYIYIINSDRTMLLNPTEQNVFIDDYNKVVDKHFEVFANTDQAYIEYKWYNPQTKVIENKLSYIRKLAQSDWIIGSGFYQSQLEADAAKELQSLHKAYETRYKKLLVVGVILTFISLVISLIIASFIEKRLARYRFDLFKKNKQLKKLNTTLEKKVQERTEELEKAKKSFEHMAMTDSLTGIHNRYSIMKMIDKEIHRVQRGLKHFSLIMYDHDYFKSINDTYGHDIGDKVLCGVVDVVQKDLRAFDAIGRYGGEEFLILLPQTEIEDAIKIAQRIHRHIKEHSIEDIGYVTVSMGVTEFKENDTINTLLKRADDFLYQAKDEGRDKIVY